MSIFEFRTNSVYVQGPNALRELRFHTYPLGSKFMIITGCGPLTDNVVSTVRKSFDNPMASNVQETSLRYAANKARAEKYDAQNKDIQYEIFDFEGMQVTRENVDKYAALAEKMDADVLIAIGGGKTLDIVRAVHIQLGRCEVALCPTSAATNAPASTLTVIYDEAGMIVDMQRMDRYPSLVLADTSLIAQAPLVTLAAGIGDCMGSHVESLLLMQELNRRNMIVDGAWRARMNVKEVFYKNGLKAFLAAKNGVLNIAFESIVAQIMHTSGPTGVTASLHMAHIIDEMLTYFKPCEKMLHGLLVGYAAIPTMLCANYPLEEIYEYVDFCLSLGIPVTLEDLGIACEPVEKFVEAAKATVNGPNSRLAQRIFTPEELYKNIFMANDLVKSYLASKGEGMRKVYEEVQEN